MGVFARIARLLKSNVLELISRAEDPIKLLDQLIAELNAANVDARKTAALAIAEEKRTQLAADRARAAAAEWERRAILALRSGEDELARAALTRKGECEDEAAALAAEVQRHAEASAMLRRALTALDTRVREARRRKELLVARHRASEARRKIADLLSGADKQALLHEFDRVAGRIEEQALRSEAAWELSVAESAGALEQRIEDLARQRRADDELAALKRLHGVSAPKVRVDVSAPASPPQPTDAPRGRTSAEDPVEELRRALAAAESETPER